MALDLRAFGGGGSSGLFSQAADRLGDPPGQSALRGRRSRKESPRGQKRPDQLADPPIAPGARRCRAGDSARPGLADGRSPRGAPRRVGRRPRAGDPLGRGAGGGRRAGIALLCLGSQESLCLRGPHSAPLSRLGRPSGDRIPRNRAGERFGLLPNPCCLPCPRGGGNPRRCPSDLVERRPPSGRSGRPDAIGRRPALRADIPAGRDRDDRIDPLSRRGGRRQV